jgi:hypothetical protein
LSKWSCKSIIGFFNTKNYEATTPQQKYIEIQEIIIRKSSRRPEREEPTKYKTTQVKAN